VLDPSEALNLAGFSPERSASVDEYYFKSEKKTVSSFIKDFLPPALGVIACSAIWLGLPLLTFTIGGT